MQSKCLLALYLCPGLSLPICAYVINFLDSYQLGVREATFLEKKKNSRHFAAWNLVGRENRTVYKLPRKYGIRTPQTAASEIPGGTHK
jgi:hypothetical protein